MKEQRKKTTATITPQPTGMETKKQVDEDEKDEEENDEEHQIPDTLERQIGKLMGEGGNTHEITMEKGKGWGEIQNPELDNRPRSRPRSRQGQKRLRPADEQNSNEETHTPDTLERQIEKPQDNDGDKENIPWEIKLKRREMEKHRKKTTAPTNPATNRDGNDRDKWVEERMMKNTTSQTL